MLAIGMLPLLMAIAIDGTAAGEPVGAPMIRSREE